MKVTLLFCVLGMTLFNTDDENIFQGLEDIVTLPVLNSDDWSVMNVNNLVQAETTAGDGGVFTRPAQSLTAQVVGKHVGTTLHVSPVVKVKVVTKLYIQKWAPKRGAFSSVEKKGYQVSKWEFK